MPTKKGYSKPTIAHNIREMIHSGMKPTAAAAAAYRIARQAAKKAGRRPAHLR
jgi:hypothetical protein